MWVSDSDRIDGSGSVCFRWKIFVEKNSCGFILVPSDTFSPLTAVDLLTVTGFQVHKGWDPYWRPVLEGCWEIDWRLQRWAQEQVICEDYFNAMRGDQAFTVKKGSNYPLPEHQFSGLDACSIGTLKYCVEFNHRFQPSHRNYGMLPDICLLEITQYFPNQSDESSNCLENIYSSRDFGVALLNISKEVSNLQVLYWTFAEILPVCWAWNLRENPWQDKVKRA